MKRNVVIVAAALLVVGVGAPASVHNAAAADLPPSGAAPRVETFTGRVIGMDLNAGTFTVSRHHKVLTLNAADGVDLKLLKRGERVIVTYSNGTALKVQSTRDIR